jgi:hypothetical protein
MASLRSEVKRSCLVPDSVFQMLLGEESEVNATVILMPYNLGKNKN